MPVSKVAVIGAGTMGSGIAQVSAQVGWGTRLYDTMSSALDDGRNRIEDFWDRGIAKGKTTIEQKNSWSKNLSYSVNLTEAVSDADLVVEAVPERKDLKIAVFKELQALAPSHSILENPLQNLKSQSQMVMISKKEASKSI